MTVILIANAQFVYIEKYVDIPQQWFDHAKLICPGIRISDMFHYNTVAGVGYVCYPLVFYFYKAFKFIRGTPLKFKMSENETDSRASVFEAIIRIVICLILD